MTVKTLIEKIGDGIQSALREFPSDEIDKGILIDWTLSFEMMSPDGGTYLKHYSTADVTAWKELGMLISAADDVRARMRAQTTDLYKEDEQS